MCSFAFYSQPSNYLGHLFHWDPRRDDTRRDSLKLALGAEFQRVYPESQTAYESVNSMARMKRIRLALFVLLSGGTLCFAQSPTAPIEMKGHRVGESVMQFLAVEKAEGNLTHCHDQLVDTALTAKVSELKRCSSSGDTGQRCYKLITDAKLQLADAEIDECVKLGAAINGGSAKLGSRVLKMPLPGSASFDHGKLVEMELSFWNLPGNDKSFAGGYDVVLQDFIAKFGTPTKSWADEFQNGFGARFSYRRASWETDTVTILLTELEGHSASSLMRDRVYFSKTAQDAAAKHQNVLDR